MSVIVKMNPVPRPTTGLGASRTSSRTGSGPSYTFIVDMQDVDMIITTLKQIGIEEIYLNETDRHILFKLDGLSMGFAPYQKKFIFCIFGHMSNYDANVLKEELEEQYLLVLQDAVYQKIKANAAEKGLNLQEEIIQPDQTIVLTYEITD